MRDRETIDSELRRVASELRLIRERGGRPSSQQVDALLDERLGHPVEVLCDTAVLDEILAPFEESIDRPRRRRRGRLLRFALRAAVPMSVLAIAAVLAVMFMLHRHQRPTEPVASTTQVSDERSTPVPGPPLVPPPAATSQADIAEKAMVEALQHEGVPVPSREYASAQGHAVCDFLSKQPSFSDATQFVQRSTIWDNQQSADFTAAAVVTYCPQFEQTSNAQMQQTFQKSVTNMQTIENDLQGINRDLQGISDGLHPGS
ncbi:DUF732 domain-containing protein [Candidatus Mycobacterium wuenschmannii]|uniref:DUF732 domain-containing protein n=1 Tax=Candidatus Mycobacterium wuenschmannii TaxID=3027808 RepID=A0ABY8VWG7_9MYCO|nr:DUF732 domain-containing protein [Candidatus Mycobacterium wuenschmannii]WIM86498.1 DUF732 domain-containing protein [Candidatus Mycobacterium wuenschmannii]